CVVSGLRHKEDLWNGITPGLLAERSPALRNGYKAARNDAIDCGLLMAVFDGVDIGVQRAAAGSTRLH
ncbi:hypothetical protein LZ30DRAFT_610795, partial [Colletotrichum cereale]